MTNEQRKAKLEKAKAQLGNLKATDKDLYRARGLEPKTRKTNSTLRTNAYSMADKITCPIKLVQRTKAVVQVFGLGNYLRKRVDYRDSVLPVFAQRMYEMGFTRDEINIIVLSSV